MSARGAPVAAGLGADRNVILSQGQQVTGFSSNPLVNSSANLGNASRQDITQTGPGADKKIVLSQGQGAIDPRSIEFEPIEDKPDINCEGRWGSCDFTTGLQTYSIKQLESGFGKPCPNKTGDVQPCSVNFFKRIRNYIAENTTTSNLMVLVFIVLVISVITSALYLIRDYIV